MYEEAVSDFHQLTQVPEPPKPVIPEKIRLALRITLIQEELNELQEALESGDLENACKELCDLQYVVSGTALEMGLKEVFYDMFHEIHYSNMSKACTTKQQIEDSINYYVEQKGLKRNQIRVIKREENVWILVRDDGKILKNVHYHRANVKKFLGNEIQKNNTQRKRKGRRRNS